MHGAAVTLVMLAVFGWGLVSAQLSRADLSAPIVFVLLGLLFADGAHVVDPEVTQEIVKLLAEVTLVWVLFADASRVGPREVRADLGLYTRLLAVGLPLTIAGGSAAGRVALRRARCVARAADRRRPRADRRGAGCRGDEQPRRTAEGC
ncbi:hypothetical protein AB0G04_18385 [Actinoplanes sp. NPDC023801]|uniref:hypothetical protein n=1 Tax=Actinoplanes sp. NPDC023801 TaxID=3154595 RepID=UPI003404E975